MENKKQMVKKCKGQLKGTITYILCWHEDQY